MSRDKQRSFLSQGSLRTKILALTGGSMAVLGLVVGATILSQARSVLEGELRQRSHAVAHGLAENHAFTMFMDDREGLKAAAEGTLRQVPDVAYVVFRTPDGKPAAAAFATGIDAARVPAPELDAGGAAADRELRVGEVPVLDLTSRLTHVEAGMMGTPKPLGTVQIGVRTDGVCSQITTITKRAAGLGVPVFAAALVVAFVFARMLTRPLERLSRASAGVAAGDLRQSVAVDGRDEIAQTSQSFQSMSEGLRTMVAHLQEAAVQVDSEAKQILQTATQQASMTSQQAAAITQTSTTVTEIAQTSRQATEHADAVIQVAQKSEDLSHDGQRSVEQAKNGIDALAEQVKAIAATISTLSERTRQVEEIISTVKDVAEQSNILALNAAIEASKAGEHGRGFSVVATEMRNLAEQSKAAAAQVRTLLGEIQAGTRNAVSVTEEGAKRAQAALELANAAGHSIVGLAEVIRESSLAARQIANNTRQQTIGVDQIVAAIAELSGAIHDAAEGTKGIQQATASLGQVSTQLAGMVSRYQV